MSANYVGQPWGDTRYVPLTPWVKWETPGQVVEGTYTAFHEDEFPADPEKGKPAQPYVVMHLNTGEEIEREVALSLKDLREQMDREAPEFGDVVRIKFLRVADKTKLFDVQVARKPKGDPVAADSTLEPWRREPRAAESQRFVDEPDF